jgi:hypothetical protein
VTAIPPVGTALEIHEPPDGAKLEREAQEDVSERPLIVDLDATVGGQHHGRGRWSGHSSPRNGQLENQTRIGEKSDRQKRYQALM